ncbi:MAG: alkaline phosphatase family protein [Chromatiaceae bacterium]|nr:alkaline phosphatase family protein [Chromatiaceae bacterium]
MVRYRGLMIIIDGVGDRRCPEMAGSTPLEAAATPNLDRLAQAGITGQIDPLVAGAPVGTHTGTGVLMGLAPADAARLARGPVEAAGIGLDLQPGEVVLRCNFATLAGSGDGMAIRDRRAGRIQVGTAELAAELQDLPLGDGISGSLHPATQHRAVLWLRGSDLSAEVTDTDPGSGREARGQFSARPRDPGDRAAVRTAEAINMFVQEAHRRLSGHPLNRQREAAGLLPANGILTRGAGRATALGNMVTHLGLGASVITGERTVEGLGRLFGFRVINQPGFTALPQTNLDGKLAAALAQLDSQDLVFLHIKGPDISSHDCDPMGKRACIERIDRMLGGLPHDDLVIGITGDHSTDSGVGRHCGDPVPAVMVAPNGRRDAVMVFGESSCMVGGMGRVSATSFLIGMLDAMGAMNNFEPADRPFLLPG